MRLYWDQTQLLITQRGPCTELFLPGEVRHLIGKERSRPKARGNPQTEFGGSRKSWLEDIEQLSPQESLEIRQLSPQESLEIQEAEVAMLVECGRGTPALSIYSLYKRVIASSGGLGETQTGSFEVTLTSFGETTHKPSFRMNGVCWLKVWTLLIT